MRRFALTIVAVAFGAISLFFLYYSVRLAYVWMARMGTRSTAAGMYVGAIVFPGVCVVAAVLSVRFARASRQTTVISGDSQAR